MNNHSPLLFAQQLSISHMGKSQPVIDGVDLTIQHGEIITILGPSGVGKSTLLSALAGLHVPEKGQIELQGKPITQQKSEMAFMFQNAVLLPWLNVTENVAFGQYFKNQEKQNDFQIQARVNNALKRVKLDHIPHAKPNTLSGGMAQRVALARALAKSPRLLLLDEPFSALDELNRAQLQRLLVDLVQGQEIGAAIMITHDIDEALLISDRILFLSGQPANISQMWVLQHSNHPRNLWENEYSMIRNEILKQLHQHQATTLEKI
ncbi:ABC transporter ATP-binding protein [Acinetobacter sp. ANC 5383]